MKILKISGLIVAFLFLFLFNYILIYIYYQNKEIANSVNQLFSSEPLLYKKENNQILLSGYPLVLGELKTQATITDARVANLQRFFRKYDSPLFNSAQAMVTISDKYGFDYRLLAAIAMQESNLCKFAPENSYNCWGFGIYGGNVIRFKSYEEAMETVAKTLKKDYIDKGLVTPSLIMAKYTPSSKGSWAKAIIYFFQQLEK